MDITNNVSNSNIELVGGAKTTTTESSDYDIDTSDTSNAVNSISDSNINDLLNGEDLNLKIKNFDINELNKLSSFNKLNNNQKTLIINRIFEKLPKNIKINKSKDQNDSYFWCKSCGYNEIIPDGMFLFSRGNEKLDNLNYHRINEYTKYNVLPTTKNYNCINPECKTHKNFNIKSAVFFRENLSYNTKYICEICNTNWNTYIEA